MVRQRRRKEAAPRTEVSKDEDSLLIQSAAALGRVIRSLQRQLRAATKTKPSRRKTSQKKSTSRAVIVPKATRS